MAFGYVETYTLVAVPIRDGLDDFSVIIHTTEHKVAMWMGGIRVPDNHVWCVLSKKITALKIKLFAIF